MPNLTIEQNYADMKLDGEQLSNLATVNSILLVVFCFLKFTYFFYPTPFHQSFPKPPIFTPPPHTHLFNPFFFLPVRAHPNRVPEA